MRTSWPAERSLASEANLRPGDAVSMTTIGILGTGNVARALTGGLREAGHTLIIGSRHAKARTSLRWIADAGARLTDTADAARSADVVVNATPGEHSLALLTSLRRELEGKVLIDTANAVEQGADGLAARLLHPDTSLAEEIQRAMPRTRVVKTLNTMGPASLMAAPQSLSVPPVAFLSGDDPAAKRTVAGLLGDLGWPPHQVIDLGGIASARVPEAFVLLVRPLIRALGPVPLALSVAR
ncbi:NADPH-dependent F420 reductase [Nonomuraea maritima]|uniref:NADPH-dependent F420 reductase n=1 Tax=Nonomuraea maritima TaxID=683260 RepID=UPI003718B206